MQIEKALVNDLLRVSEYPENLAFQLFIILQNITVLLKRILLFKFLVSFLFINNNLKAKIAVNEKISVFVISAKAII